MADWSGADLQAEINGMGGRRGIELVPLEYFSLAVNESVGTGANGPASRPLDSDPWNTHRPWHPVAEPGLQPCVVKLKLCSQIHLFYKFLIIFLHDR
jgi:hypothetical protein